MIRPVCDPVDAPFKASWMPDGWDVKCRVATAAALLAPALEAVPPQRRLVVDIGSGAHGIAEYLSHVTVVRVDRSFPERPAGPAAILDARRLPFRSRAIPFTSCVDVLEHIAAADRQSVVSEIVRVTRFGFLIAVPEGQQARECDLRFAERCRSHARALPPWLEEHLQSAPPEIDQIAAMAARLAEADGRDVQLEKSYCEPLRISHALRALAAAAPRAYAFANRFLGATFPFYTARRETAYRGVLFGTFGE